MSKSTVFELAEAKWPKDASNVSRELPGASNQRLRLVKHKNTSYNTKGAVTRGVHEPWFPSVGHLVVNVRPWSPDNRSGMSLGGKGRQRDDAFRHQSGRNTAAPHRIVLNCVAGGGGGVLIMSMRALPKVNEISVWEVDSRSLAYHARGTRTTSSADRFISLVLVVLVPVWAVRSAHSVNGRSGSQLYMLKDDIVSSWDNIPAVEKKWHTSRPDVVRNIGKTFAVVIENSNRRNLRTSGYNSYMPSVKRRPLGKKVLVEEWVSLVGSGHIAHLNSNASAPADNPTPLIQVGGADRSTIESAVQGTGQAMGAPFDFSSPLVFQGAVFLMTYVASLWWDMPARDAVLHGSCEREAESLYEPFDEAEKSARSNTVKSRCSEFHGTTQ
ncbi:hypothetical protein B0H17DRAFT_1147650 [Mycena rosella]|uniref:Uncharacterized protein n=1 Tax=Mycena rosella TaxID=1033263 RepID=A0AAD7CL56_MYCRO|nr:hypothetical protein B0H17DRAFT_1147650 [Mycena rosella]